jgi:hypothetical protein
MADDVDLANERVAEMEEDKVAAIRRRAAAMPQGEPGDCEGCGEYFTRTVMGYCGRCRDKLLRKL